MNKYKILIVDDETSNLAVLNRILSAEYTIFTAKSGESALKRVLQEQPDLILLDIVMPDMDGFDVLSRLKSDFTARNIPVIIISGLAGEDDEEKGFRLGAVDYITKPFKNAIVKARIKTHMQIVHQIRMIERLGLIDPLTDMPNRRNFDDHMAMEWRRAFREKKVLSFMMLDVDKFKMYNDAYGHPQGDTLLKTIAKIFMAATKRPADLAARLGGEEFGILLPDTNLEGAMAIAEDIRSTVEAAPIPTIDDSSVTSTTISIGVASWTPSEGGSIQDLIAKADENLYTAKNSGRNKVIGTSNCQG